MAGLGGALTDLGPWYRALEVPPWQPPDAAFPIGWTAIFTLAAIAGTLGWRAAPTGRDRTLLVALFGLNAVLNVAWSGLFFALRRPDWALWEVGPLWLSILALVIVLARWSRIAALCLVPYLGWVAFAAALNAAIVLRNGPF